MKNRFEFLTKNFYRNSRFDNCFEKKTAELFDGNYSYQTKSRIYLTLKLEEVQLSFLLVLSDVLKARYFFDIGANVGTYSLAMNSVFKNKIFIKAFEPSSAAYLELKNNFHSKKNIESYDLAISSTTGQAEFRDYGHLSGKNSLFQTSIHNSKDVKKVTLVKTVSIDGLFNYTNTFSIFKIDTEGNELEVLKGAKEFLNNNKCIVQLETGWSEQGIKKSMEEFFVINNYALLTTIGVDVYYTNIDNLFDKTIFREIEERLNKYLISKKIKFIKSEDGFRIVIKKLGVFNYRMFIASVRFLPKRLFSKLRRTFLNP